MAANWTPDSWRSHEGLQMPVYRDAEALAAAEQQLGSYPPLVFEGEARNLKAELAEVVSGKSFLLQGGDCAASFAELNPNNKLGRASGGEREGQHWYTAGDDV